MSLPTVEQYSRIIERKDPSTLLTLTDHTFLYNETGFSKQYCFEVGTSAAVYKAVKGTSTYAIRCFLRGELETFKRYEQLASFLREKELPWKVGFEFLDNEILYEGQFYPVVKMDWVEGTPLNVFIDEYRSDAQALSLLQKKLVELDDNLEKNGVGHGDLKYNNIYIQYNGKDFNLKLIDYDSLYIPAFRGKKNLETGSPGFQPLKRLSSHFSETIDRFSIWVMLTTIEAVKTDPRVWMDMEQGGFNNEHSLFSASDFFNPASSTVIIKLKNYNNEGINYYLDKIIGFSKISDLSSIEKPRLFKEFESIPFEHQKWVPPAAPSTLPVQQPIVPPPPPVREKEYLIEIKTIPSGKDVLVGGNKKGITPLRLQLLKQQLNTVEIVNEGDRLPLVYSDGIESYEFDFSKKPKETAPPIEQDEIIEFRADRYTVQEGELATINWNVKGTGKIHISHMGDVEEKVGTKKVVLNNTTNYVLTVGTKNRSFTINVQPKPKPAPVVTVPEPKPVTEDRYIHMPAPVTSPAPQPQPIPTSYSSPKTKNNKLLTGFLLFTGIAALSFFAFSYFSGNSEQTASETTNAEVVEKKTPLFTQSSVTDFLNKLYDAYNKRDLQAITAFYAPTVKEYYESSSLGKDSLSKVINDLFITPAGYSCRPDFKTLQVQPQEQNCKVVITVNEELKSEAESNTENYTTTIEYILDPSYKIISERNPG